MNIQDFFIQNGWLLKVIYSIMTLVIAVVLYKLIIDITEKALEKNKIFSSKKTKTYMKLAKSISKYIFILLAVLVILKIYGVNVSSMLAGIGIISIIIGLAIQDFLKDIIRGSSIISDNYFSVGDVIKYKDIEGKVLVVGLKTTKIQVLATSNILSIANRNIEEVELLSKLIYIKVPLPYELKLKEQHKAIDDIVKIIKNDKLIEDCESVGLTELADSRIEYLLKITCNADNKLQVRRNTLEHIIEGLENNNINVPYNQINVHQK
mgnify:CR=1 FL=1